MIFPVVTFSFPGRVTYHPFAVSTVSPVLLVAVVHVRPPVGSGNWRIEKADVSGWFGAW